MKSFTGATEVKDEIEFGKCLCCHKVLVTQQDFVWSCWYCSPKNNTAWKHGCDSAWKHFGDITPEYARQRQYDDIVVHTSLDKILLETDAPYLTPEPYRGKRNEPTYVLEIAKKMAEIKDIPLEKVIKITTQNAFNLFKINYKPI